MKQHLRTPILHPDTGDVLGFVSTRGSGWSAETIFGYTISRTQSQDDAEQVVRTQAQRMLQGVWRYFDADESAWFTCKLQGIQEETVVVVRTNDIGYEDPARYKRVELRDPDETSLQFVS